MSINAHRVEKVVYAEDGMTFRAGSALASAIEEHPETNDFRNMEGSGVLELPLRALKEILEEKENLEEHEIEVLTKEIAKLEKEGKDNEDYILYDMF